MRSESFSSENRAMPGQDLTSLLESRRHSPSPMLIERDHAVSYATIADEATRLASGLGSLGVRAGDRVAVWMPNVPAWIALFFACARLGAIMVSMNTRFRSHEVADILSRSGAKVLAFWPGFRGVDFAAILQACDATALERLETLVVYRETGDAPTGGSVAGKHAAEYAALAASPPHEGPTAGSDSGCVIFTTSGTTKAPKFVLHDQARVTGHGFDVARAFGLDADAVMLLAPPLCGVYGFCGLMAAFAAGRPLVMRPVWDAALAARDIVAHRVTHFNATDEAAHQLLRQSEAPVPFPSVRFAGCAAFNPALGDIVERAAVRGLCLVGLYGTSEIQALFSRQSEDAPSSERKLGGGRLVGAAARVRARDPLSGRVLPHRESGELEFFAPGSRMVGYFGDPDATAEAFTTDGYYRSGDLGYSTPDGGFVFLTRLGDALRLGGFLVSPAEIEDVVLQLPGIEGCQVVAVTHEGASRAVAFVILQPGAVLDEPALLAHVGSKLAKYKVPARVFAVDAFPVTTGANGTKIQKHRLREMAQERLLGQQATPARGGSAPGH